MKTSRLTTPNGAELDAASDLIQDRQRFAWITSLSKIGGAPREAGSFAIIRKDYKVADQRLCRKLWCGSKLTL